MGENNETKTSDKEKTEETIESKQPIEEINQHKKDDSVYQKENIDLTEEKVEKNEESNKLSETEQIIEEKKASKKEEIQEREKSKILENQLKSKANIKKKIIIIFVAILFLMIISTVFAILNINNEKMIKGIHTEGINLSNLTKEEAYQTLNDKINEMKEKEIIIRYNDYSKTIIPEQIEIDIDINQIVEQAHKVGRNSNIIADNFQILKAMIFKHNIEYNIQYNEQLLNDILDTIEQEIPGKVEEYSYEINNDKLIIRNGKEGLVIQKDKLEKDIIQEIKKYLSGKSEDINVYISAYIEKPEKINIEDIHQKIYKEAEDAYIKEDPFEVHVEQNGLDFDISIHEAKSIIQEDKEEYEIPLKITKPNKTVSDLGDKVFKESLAKYTTIFDSGNINRASNIGLAAKTINGTILNPGETFSYNKILGNTTKEKGYKLGGAYVNGQVVQAYGGGICQVSTTLYNAVLYANLEIVQRYNHTYAVSYVPAGRDATVSYGGKDFKFKNNRKYPIKIEANAQKGSVSVSIKGIKEEKEYEIQLESKVLSRTPCKVVYQETNTLAEGKQKVIQKGYNGYKSITYKITKENGKIISKETLSSDTYQPMNKIVMIGTKKATINDNNSNKNQDSKEQVINEITQTTTQDALEP